MQDMLAMKKNFEKILFITGHDPDTARKVDLHFMAKDVLRNGVEAYFIVIGKSLLGKLIKRQEHTEDTNRWIKKERIAKFIWRPSFHPMKIKQKWIERLTAPTFGRYPLLFPVRQLEKIGTPDTIIIESGAGLALTPLLRKKFPQAYIIYSVSDRLERLDVPKEIYEFETASILCFDKIRVPSPLMLTDYQNHPNVIYIPHGIDRASFDEARPSPYKTGKNAISIGDSLFDAVAIKTLAQAHPDWTFHLFGRLAKLDRNFPNVIEHGETEFGDIVPYIQHADMGLALYRYAPASDYISHSSLRMIQYTYCRLPIITPEFSAKDRPHAFAYTIGNMEELLSAFVKAENCDRTKIDNSKILSWEQITKKILEQ